MEAHTYEIQELVALTGIQRRNIYFYVQQGLLPPPVGAGLAARYTEAHLLRLRLLPLLRRRGLKLDQIREQMAGMSAEEMKTLLGREGHEAQEPLREQVPSHASAGQTCLRYDLPGGIVLIVPVGLPSRYQTLVEDLLEAAGQVRI